MFALRFVLGYKVAYNFFSSWLIGNIPIPSTHSSCHWKSEKKSCHTIQEPETNLPCSWLKEPREFVYYTSDYCLCCSKLNEYRQVKKTNISNRRHERRKCYAKMFRHGSSDIVYKLWYISVRWTFIVTWRESRVTNRNSEKILSSIFRFVKSHYFSACWRVFSVTLCTFHMKLYKPTSVF